MAHSSLRDELLRVPGVAEAEVDESGDTPAGVRVRLSPDADARTVGAEVQRVLAAHGMRSRVTGPDDGAAETESGNGLTDEAPEGAAPPPITAVPAPPEEPPPSPSDSIESADLEESAAEETPPEVPAAGPFELAAVRVEERADSIAVTAVASDGRTLTRRVEATEQAMLEATVAVVGALAEGQPPGLVSLEWTGGSGSDVVTVVIDAADGRRTAGAAVVRSGKAFAVGRATAAALRSG